MTYTFSWHCRLGYNISVDGHLIAGIQHEASVETVSTEMPAPAGGLEKALTALPVVTRRAGETVLSAGLKTDLLLILKKGAVVILKDSVEIARVDQLGAVLGEISALLGQPHTAEVRALEESQFYVADAALLEKDPSAVLYVARIMAARLLAADTSLVGLKKQLGAGGSPISLSKIIETFEKILTRTAPTRSS
jgi:CRP/FNR family transcriptional regulator, cyclic AMP receptor protein